MAFFPSACSPAARKSGAPLPPSMGAIPVPRITFDMISAIWGPAYARMFFLPVGLTDHKR